MMKRSLLTLLTVTALGLPACSSVLTDATPADSIYILNPPSIAANEAGHFNGRLMIERPQLPEGLQSDRISLVKADRELDYMAGASWSGRLDKVLQNYFETAFEVALPLGSVVTHDFSMDATYVLAPKVTHFEAHYEGYEAAEPPLVKVEINFSLIRRKDGALINQISLKKDVRADSNTQTSIVAAFESALGAVTAQAAPLLLKR
ncbi:MAG: ABC-type transport auxiliary lipoprotein family protein [Pseudobdellovibrionaceae bacterium]